MKHLLSIGLSFFMAFALAAQPNCDTDLHGLIPIPDLGEDTYLGAQGGLYPGGSNDRPVIYLNKGLNQAGKIKPLNSLGNFDCANGKIVLMSIGGSNPAGEFSNFKTQADAYAQKNPKLTIVNSGGLGKIPRIFKPTNAFWDSVASNLSIAGVTKKQVQVIWLETDDVNNPNIDFPDAASDLRDSLVKLCHLLVDSFPNVRFCFPTARAYAGYAADDFSAPGLIYPRDYYNGWAIKWLIEDQISGDPALKFNGPDRVAPFVSWATYLWTDGDAPCDYTGLSWTCPTHFQPDGFHLNTNGKAQAGQALFDFFSTDTLTKSWFLDSYSCLAPPEIAYRNATSTQVTLFPNPAQDVLNLRVPEEMDFQVQVTDAQGRECLFSKNESTLGLQNLQNGVYLLRVWVGDSLVVCKKLVKQL